MYVKRKHITRGCCIAVAVDKWCILWYTENEKRISERVKERKANKKWQGKKYGRLQTKKRG